MGKRRIWKSVLYQAAATGIGLISCVVRTGYILYEEYGDFEPESQNAPKED